MSLFILEQVRLFLAAYQGETFLLIQKTAILIYTAAFRKSNKKYRTFRIPEMPGVRMKGLACNIPF